MPAKFTEQQTSFFLGHVCMEADPVFRFAYALTLDQDLAFAGVKKAFEQATLKLGELSNKTSSGIRVFLMSQCYESWQNDKKQSKTPTSPLAKFFSDLDVETRAALVAIDICGCTIEEAQSVLGQKDDVLHKNLAKARKHMVSAYANG